jgi:hypothetical protein
MKKTVEMLTYLREALDSANKVGAKLDMESWVSANDIQAKGVIDDSLESASACGTTCCNAGWAGFHPKLRDLGLVTTILPINSGLGIPLKYKESFSLNGDEEVMIRAWHDDDGGEGSLQDFFRITEVESVALFSSEYYEFEVCKARNSIVPNLVPEDFISECMDDYMTLDKSIQLVDALIEKYKNEEEQTL